MPQSGKAYLYMDKKNQISNRKNDHIDITGTRNVSFRQKRTGFEQYDFLHCAVPELNFDTIDCSADFLGYRLSAPLMVTGITGGCEKALDINRALAEACSQEAVAIGVGSQRQLLENSKFIKGYTVVREAAGNVPVIGNIGAAQLRNKNRFDAIMELVDVLQADAIAVHLNPLQEILQPEGDKDFSGILAALEQFVRFMNVPVMVKETGCGISYEAARKIHETGVEYIDIAGAGGTSWSAIESFRAGDARLAESFWDWGIPTAESLNAVRPVEHIRIVASGGVRNGIDMAKALALGADLCGAAMPFLHAFQTEGKEGLTETMALWRRQLKTVLFLTGSERIEQLRRPGICFRVNRYV